MFKFPSMFSFPSVIDFPSMFEFPIICKFPFMFEFPSIFQPNVHDNAKRDDAFFGFRQNPPATHSGIISQTNGEMIVPNKSCECITGCFLQREGDCCQQVITLLRLVYRFRMTSSSSFAGQSRSCQS